MGAPRLSFWKLLEGRVGLARTLGDETLPRRESRSSPVGTTVVSPAGAASGSQLRSTVFQADELNEDGFIGALTYRRLRGCQPGVPELFSCPPLSQMLWTVDIHETARKLE